MMTTIRTSRLIPKGPRYDRYCPGSPLACSPSCCKKCNNWSERAGGTRALQCVAGAGMAGSRKSQSPRNPRWYASSRVVGCEIRLGHDHRAN